MSASNIALVTTSWDDGHPLDLRVAERLAAYGVKGTFYIPVDYPLIPRMSRCEIQQLRRMGMEIGSHTQTHPRIHRLDAAQVLRELRDSKAYLEDLLGEEIHSFCYPEGKFAAHQMRLVDEAGYKLARTTVGFRTSLEFEPHLMPVSVQFWPHSRHTLVRHALLQGNLRGLSDWLRLWHAEHDPARLANAMLGRILADGGVLHIWGHSWEIEQKDLWSLLEGILARIRACSELRCLTNSEVLEAAAQAKYERAGVCLSA